MILRRVTQHVKDQNWFAIARDFFIVVAGVFIGIQLGNWNAARVNKAATISGLERLRGEVAVNVSAADEVISRIEAGSEIRASAIRALTNCDASDQASEDVQTALGTLTSDILPAFINNMTTELAREDRYTPFLSNEFLSALNIYDGNITDETEQLSVNFGLMWDDHVSKNPMVSLRAGNLANVTDTQFILIEPIDVLCKDNLFTRQFLMTDIWHQSTFLRLGRFKTRSDTFLEALDAEMETFK